MSDEITYGSYLHLDELLALHDFIHGALANSSTIGVLRTGAELLVFSGERRGG